MEAHYENTYLPVGAGALNPGRLRRLRNGPARDYHHYRNAGSHNHRPGEPRSRGDSGSAGRAGRNTNRFAWPKLRLDSRLLGLEGRDLRLDTRELGTSPTAGCRLGGRTLVATRGPLRLGRRSLAVITAGFSASPAGWLRQPVQFHQPDACGAGFPAHDCGVGSGPKSGHER
jgi:hypothetical protein